MKDFVRALGIVLIAALGSIGVVIVLIISTHRLTEFSLQPTHFLPQSETVALVAHPNEQTNKYLNAWMGNDIPVGEFVAWTRSNNTRNTLIFTKNTEGKGAFGLYDVHSAVPGIQAMLMADTPHLVDDAVYTDVTDGWNTQSSWIFKRLLDDEADPLLRVLQQNGYTAVSILPTDDKTEIRLMGNEKPYTGSIDSAVSGTATDTAIRLLDGQSVWRTMQRLFDISQGVITDGIMEAKTQKAFGGTFFATAILPLVQQESTLYVRRNQSGSLLYALHAQSNDNFADMLHEAYASALPRIRTVHHVFDDRFSSTDVRIDPSVIRQEKGAQNGWALRSTQHETLPGGFFSAKKGNETIIGNDRSLLEDIVSEHEIRSIPRGSTLRKGALFAGGSLHVPTLLSLLTHEVPGFTLPMESPLLSQLSGSILWSIEQKGPITTVLIKREK